MSSLRSVVQRWPAVPTQANTADLTTMSTCNIVTRVTTEYTQHSPPHLCVLGHDQAVVAAQLQQMLPEPVLDRHGHLPVQCRDVQKLNCNITL